MEKQRLKDYNEDSKEKDDLYKTLYSNFNKAYK
jgi:hypothetical protein